MAEELTGQLAEAIPGAVAIMAEALGYVTKTGLPDTAKLFKEMEKGAIDGSDALNKFSVELKKLPMRWFLQPHNLLGLNLPDAKTLYWS